MDKGTKVTVMSDDELMKKWLSTFGKNVDKGIIEEHLILSILVYTFFSRMFDLMLPPEEKHSIAVA